MNDDFIDHIRLTKPPPACMCNCSGGDSRVYSLVACEPNDMLVLYVNQTKTINQFAKIVTVLGEPKKKRKKKKKKKKDISVSICFLFFSLR
jgi:hypothetical protein